MEYLISILLGVLGSLAASEAYAWAPKVAQTIIVWTANRLPPSEYDRWKEEWLAHLDEIPGNLSKLGHAVGCIRGTIGMVRAAPKIAVASRVGRRPVLTSFTSTMKREIVAATVEIFRESVAVLRRRHLILLTAAAASFLSSVVFEELLKYYLFPLIRSFFQK